MDKAYIEHIKMLSNALHKEEMDDFRFHFLDMHPYDQAVYFFESTERKSNENLFLFISIGNGRVNGTY